MRLRLLFTGGILCVFSSCFAQEIGKISYARVNELAVKESLNPVRLSIPDNDLQFVKSRYQSPHGLIVSEWKKNDNDLELKMIIPTGINAQLWIPAGKSSASLMTDRKPVKVENGSQIFNTGSGEYNVTVKNLF